MIIVSQNLEILLVNNINYYVKRVRENCKKKFVVYKGYENNYSKVILYQMFLKCCYFSYSISIILDLIKYLDWGVFILI